MESDELLPIEQRGIYSSTSLPGSVWERICVVSRIPSEMAQDQGDFERTHLFQQLSRWCIQWKETSYN